MSLFEREWEHALACYYDSSELAAALADLPIDERDLGGDARVAGGVLLTRMLEPSGTISDLPTPDDLELLMIRHCASIHWLEPNDAVRAACCDAAIRGAAAFLRWWGNVLLGLHPDAISQRAVPPVGDVVARVQAFDDIAPAITARCATAADGARQGIEAARTAGPPRDSR